ncbi:TPA: outer membrane protein assembly factor BamA [Candidatus Dependentiae bacterium]|nr:MAG: Outer membrane protein assembly factor BamA [candidate division TM6 bacterium GW2011_GWE2_31_21]KKP53480.1 MAG: Outer membrane protein assembly factor BamA [candidate division TM6 bacterium GW2011_GWF2_33_332]HBS48278.1 outer membrane protein assembly factor BamA [Candidatus Dependentiae bacterium]HBZ73705.1 outer membrane protein assembly factor BamA [Candidatus Dependentiae bacterium]
MTFRFKISTTIFVLFFICNSINNLISAPSMQRSKNDLQQEESFPKKDFSKYQDKKIQKIIVEGNKQITTEMVKSKLPYKEGDLFDPMLSSDAIRNLESLKYFRQIKIEVDSAESDSINLYVVLQENPKLEKYEFVGNHAIKTKKIVERLTLDKVETVDDVFMKRSCESIKAMYKEEGFLFADVKGKLVLNDKGEKANIIFEITEGSSLKVMTISFVGNKRFLSSKLRQILFTKENWVLGKLTGAGKYIPEALEYDKHLLEHFYQDNGYLLAKVTDVKVEYSENKKNIFITFHIEEGDRFRISKISAPGDDVLLESDILSQVLLEEGQYYNATKVTQSVERLKDLWGDKGFVNADVYPQITPSEEEKTVEVSFYADRGDKVFVRKIDITGNDVTNDRVIRHAIGLEEGDLLTNKKLQQAQDDVERLSYFDKGGVNWRLHKINDEKVDLEMNVKETKTGKAELNASLGSDADSNKRALKVGFDLEKRNFMGEGYDVGAKTQVQLAKGGSKLFEMHFLNPHLWDSDVSCHVEGFHKTQEFDEWVNVNSTPYVKESGGDIGLGFALNKIDKYLNIEAEVGFEFVDARKNNVTKGSTAKERKALKMIMDNSFRRAPLQWLGLNFIKDTRNHIAYPNKGYKFIWSNKVALPGVNKDYSFLKMEADLSCYTALIGDDALVLMLHGLVGTVFQIGQDKSIPYKELFHMGGQSTVRGFRFGGIGPSWKNQDPLGGRNAILFNTELIFPLVEQMGIKAHVFYDAGAGWSTPKYGTVRPDLITRNAFDFRQSIGFGFNITQPQPIKIDWGYKLDRRPGESPSELHLSANVAF